MNGIHDMGGMEGFGPVQPEPNEPPFHSTWEGRCLAMNRAMGYAKVWNIDESRAAIEKLPPIDYLGMTYYEKWAFRLQQLLLKHGLVDADEFAAGHALRPGKELPRKLPLADVPKSLTRGSYARPPRSEALFKVGDRVRTRNMHPHYHTRLPRYARDRTGVVECVRGYHVFPDALASGRGEDPQWLYTILFESRELWGASADPTMTLSIEAWEPYLDAAT